MRSVLLALAFLQFFIPSRAPAADDRVVEFDASKNKFEDKTVAGVRAGQRVGVLLKNVNTFRYAYKVTIDQSTLTTETVPSALTAIFGTSIKKGPGINVENLPPFDRFEYLYTRFMAAQNADAMIDRVARRKETPGSTRTNAQIKAEIKDELSKEPYELDADDLATAAEN